MLLRRRRRRAYAPTSNAAGHDNHEKINSWVSVSFLYEYGALLGDPSDRWSSAKKARKTIQTGAGTDLFHFLVLRGAELVDEHVHAQLDAVRREDKGKMDRIKKS